MFEINVNEKKRVAIYCRVSTDEQALNWTSLESQKESIISYVENNSNLYVLNEDKHIYIDWWYSWWTDNRPALKKLMLDSKKDEFDMVLVFKLDRFFRKTLYLLQYIEELQDYDIWFKSVTQEFDTSWYWKMIIWFLWIMAEFERDMIRERTVLGKVKKAKQGYYVWWGWVRYWYDAKVENNWCKLAINKEEAKIINRIFEMYVNEKKTIWSIATILTEQWVLTKYDKQHKWKDHNKRLKAWFWYGWNIRAILSEEMYIWKYYYWKTYTKKDRRTGKEITFLREKGDPLLVEMSCPKILKDDEIFYKSKQLLDKNKNNKNWNRTYNFTWYIECWKCWRNYIWYKTCKDTYSYRCWGSVWWKIPKEFRCWNHEISDTFILDYVWNQLDKLLSNPDNILEEYYRKNWKELWILEEYKQELKEVNIDIEKNTNWLTHIYSEYYTETDENIKKIKETTINNFKSKVWVLSGRKEELEAKIEKFSRVERNKNNIKRVVSKFITKFKWNIEQDKKIDLIKEFVDRIKVLENWNVVVWLKFYTWDNKNKQSDDEWW